MWGFENDIDETNAHIISREPVKPTILRTQKNQNLLPDHDQENLDDASKVESSPTDSWLHLNIWDGQYGGK
jgi:hypothetical protein